MFVQLKHVQSFSSCKSLCLCNWNMLDLLSSCFFLYEFMLTQLKHVQSFSSCASLWQCNCNMLTCFRVGGFMPVQLRHIRFLSHRASVCLRRQSKIIQSLSCEASAWSCRQSTMNPIFVPLSKRMLMWTVKDTSRLCPIEQMNTYADSLRHIQSLSHLRHIQSLSHWANEYVCR